MTQPVEKGLRRLTAWPLRWPLSMFCSHSSTTALVTEQEDGSWRESNVRCLRCGRVIPSARTNDP